MKRVTAPRSVRSGVIPPPDLTSYVRWLVVHYGLVEITRSLRINAVDVIRLATGRRVSRKTLADTTARLEIKGPRRIRGGTRRRRSQPVWQGFSPSVLRTILVEVSS